MIIYNVTIKTAHSITDEWLNWLKKEHIADVINTKNIWKNMQIRCEKKVWINGEINSSHFGQ